MKQPLIIIAGPTATGKTALAVELAKRFDGEVISADSIQVYRGLDIGSAKVTAEETQGVPHHLIDVIGAEDEWNVTEFVGRAKNIIAEIAARGRVPIVCGGTGFYIRALAYDCSFTDEEKDEPGTVCERDGLSNEELFEKLRAVDPASCEIIHPNNRKRVLRALDFFGKNGFPISSHNLEQQSKESPYQMAFLVLTRERREIYGSIDRRVDKMFDAGLENEVRGLLAAGVPRDAQSMQGIGYKETVEYIDGHLSLEEAKEKIKLETRHFAKRQLTWFRKEREAVFLDVSEPDFRERAVSIICSKTGLAEKFRDSKAENLRDSKAET